MRKHEENIGRTVTLEVAKRSCLDKKRHNSRNVARDKAAKIKAVHGKQQEPYRCTLCNGWHLRTVKPGKEKTPNP